MFIKGIELLEACTLTNKSTIREAFEELNGIFGMVITIVDKNNNFCGIVTDGDLKRSILEGYSLDHSLKLVLNKNPVTISKNDLIEKNNFEYLFGLLEKNGVYRNTMSRIMAIPVVDDQKKVLGLLTTEMLHGINQKKEINLNSKTNQKIPHVLIVGGAGYIGSVLTEILLQTGYRVRVLDNLLYDQDSLSKFMQMERFSFIQGDVCDLHNQVEAIKGVDCLVFLAEIVGDPSCEYLPETALKTNYLAVNSMATLCAHANINRFIYTSSCSVYGASSDSKKLLNEQSELNPVSHYGRMKILSEQVLFNQLNPLFSPTILRLSTVFGYSLRPRFDLVVNTFAKNAFFDSKLTIFGGDQWRPNVHVKDVADAIIKVINAPLAKVKKEVFNVGGNSENYTINDIAEMTRNVFSDCKVFANYENIDKRNYKVDCSKIQNILDFQTGYTVLDGLQELKKIFNSGILVDENNNKYSNIKSLMGKNIHEYQS